MDSPSSSSIDPEQLGVMLPWKYASRAKSLTCSPIRRGVIICMNIDCTMHVGKGANAVGHGDMRAVLANDLEWVVVNSFGAVDPSTDVHEPQFHNWTITELYSACQNTDCKAATSRRFFDCPESSMKLRQYVSSFDGASSVLAESKRAVFEPLRRHTLEETISEWSNGIDPMIYVLMLKRSNERMTRKLSIMRNTIDIWKAEAEKDKSNCVDLKRKIKFMKKR